MSLWRCVLAMSSPDHSLFIPASWRGDHSAHCAIEQIAPAIRANSQRSQYKLTKPGLLLTAMQAATGVLQTDPGAATGVQKTLGPATGVL